MNCKNCGQPLAPGAMFCGNCGARVVADQPQPQNTVQDPMMAPQRPAAAQPMRPTIPSPVVTQPQVNPNPLLRPQVGNPAAPAAMSPAPNIAQTPFPQAPQTAQVMQGGSGPQAVAPGNPYANIAQGEQSEKSYLVAYLLAQFLGGFGADRFYLGEIVTGILKLITVGGFGIWAFIDVILLLAGVRKDKQKRPFPDRKEHLKLSIIIFAVLLLLGIAFSLVDLVLLSKGVTNNNNTNSSNTSLVKINSNPGSNISHPTSQTVSLGQPLTLTDSNGDQLQVNISKIIPSAKPINAASTPSAGDQLVAVQLSIKELNGSTVIDSVDNSIVADDASGTAYMATLDTVSNCSGFSGGNYTVSDGQTVSGCEVFQLPVKSSIVKVKFTPSSGAASDTGVWNS